MAAQYQINGIRRRLRCDHCDNRGLWLLVRTRNDGGKARQRPRGGGIKHLADVLDDADFAAVEALVKPLVSSRKNPVNLAGVLPNITVPTGVRVYKAKPGGCFGDKPQYTASGIGDRSRPCIKAKLQRDARKKAMTNAATAPPPPPPTAAPPALPLLPHCRRRSHRRPGRDQHPPARDPQVRPGPVFAGWQIPCLAAPALSHCPVRKPEERRAFLFSNPPAFPFPARPPCTILKSNQVSTLHT